MASSPSGIDLSKTPGAPNPSGGEPDFVDPPSLAPAVTGVGATMIILGAIFVTARIYSNLYAARKIGWDDCKKPDHISLRTTSWLIIDFCVIATILTIGYTCVVISGISGTLSEASSYVDLVIDNEIARHGWDIPLSVVLNESIIKVLSIWLRLDFTRPNAKNYVIEKLCARHASWTMHIFCQSLNISPLHPNIWSHSMASLPCVLRHSSLIPRDLDYRTTPYHLLHPASWISLGRDRAFEVSSGCCGWNRTGNIPCTLRHFYHCAANPHNIPSQSRIQEETGSCCGFHDWIHVFSFIQIVPVAYWSKIAAWLPAPWLWTTEFYFGDTKTPCGMLLKHTFACKRDWLFHQIGNQLT